MNIIKPKKGGRFERCAAEAKRFGLPPALSDLFEQNQRLAIMTADKFWKSNKGYFKKYRIGFDAVKQEALILLWTAAENYDAVRWGSFADCSQIVISTGLKLFLQRAKKGLEKSSRLIEELRERTRYANKNGSQTALERSELRDKLVAVVNASTLSEREKTIIFKGFGLAGENKKALAAIAKELGVTPARVWEIEQRALQKLRGNKELRVLFESILEK